MNISHQYQHSTANNISNINGASINKPGTGNNLPSTHDIENDKDSVRSTNITSAKERLLEKMAKANPDEMDKILGGLSSGSHLMMISFHGDLPDLNDRELMGRLDRINNDFRNESNNFSNERNNLIASGKSQGKTSKEIIGDIINLYDQQSALFKTGSGWSGEVISGNKTNPEGYAKLLELTPNYVSNFA